jgi:cell division protein FtsW
MLIVGIGVLTLLVATSPHRRDRVLQWFEASNNMGNVSSNYQVSQGLFAINEGGWFGVGAGNSVIKLGYVPEAHTDMVIPILINEIGVVGFFIFLFFFLTMVFNLVKQSVKLNNLYLFNFTLLSALMLIFQFLINLFGVVGIIPLKGINVPFLSYGGSGIITIIVLVFLNLSLIRLMEKNPQN